MPSTFSHPLAAVLLHRVARSRLQMPALIIGSMAPDFGYYTGHFAVSRYAHTIPGTFAFCLPAGLVVLGLFYLFRLSFCFLLPQPHRAPLQMLARGRPAISMSWVIWAIASVLIGTWTHTIWDSFTHEGAWTVDRIPLLQLSVIEISGTKLKLSYLLQQASTFGAAAALAFLYFRWLRRQPNTESSWWNKCSERWRHLGWFLAVCVALGLAILPAVTMAGHYEGYTAVRVLIFRTAVYSSAWMAVLCATATVIVFFVRHFTSQFSAPK